MAKLRKKIAIVTPGTFTLPSARQSSVESIVENMSRWLKNDYELHIFSKKVQSVRFQETLDGITHIRPATGGQKYRYTVREWIIKLRPDLIQVENRPRMAKYLKEKCRSTPVWLSIHSTRFITKPHISLPELRSCLKAADTILVNSEFMKARLARMAPAVKDRIKVNYPGVDTERFASRWSDEGRRSREALLKELGYEGKKIVLYAGRLQEIKGVHHLLEAAPDIVQQHPDTVLLILGSAFYGKDEITPYVAKLHQLGNRLPRHVRFIPHVPNREMAKWFQLADAVVVPSFQDEAFGLVNVEALSAGVSVVATRAGGMPEIVQHEQNGFLVDPTRVHEELVQSVNRILEDPQLGENMGKAGAELVRNRFTWKQMAERYRDLVQENLR